MPDHGWRSGFSKVIRRVWFSAKSVIGPRTSQWTAAFAQRLRELGWTEGRTVAIEYRWAEGRSERYTDIATEFVRHNVDVIVTVGSAVAATKQVTSTIPIVFAIAVAPVGSGMVASLARRHQHRRRVTFRRDDWDVVARISRV